MWSIPVQFTWKKAERKQGDVKNDRPRMEIVNLSEQFKGPPVSTVNTDSLGSLWY